MTEFRLVYRKPKPGSVLTNFDISEVSLNGEPVRSLVRVTFDARPDGTPTLRLNRLGCITCPVLDNIHIDGYAKVEIVTEGYDAD